MDAMNEQIVTTTNIIAASSHIPSATHNSMTLVDLGKRLLDASKKGDTTEIRSLMSGGAPFTTDWLGTSPLHFAAMYGHVDTVTILLRAGISRDARTKVDRTPLHVAAQNGHFDIVKILVANNAIIDAMDMLKMTPLHWAVENGHTNIVNLLLKHSADTSIIDKFDRTPMDIALGNMQMDIVQLLQNASQQTRTAAFIQSTSIQDDIVEEEVMIDDAATSLNQVSQEEITSLSTSEQPDSEDSTVVTSEGNTSVLAALAVLAEATASTNTNTNPTVSVRTTSAVNNQNTPFTLTEAGKLALNNYFKENGMNESDHQVVTLVDEQGNQVLVVQSNQSDDPQTQTEQIPLTQNNQLIEDSVE